MPCSLQSVACLGLTLSLTSYSLHCQSMASTDIRQKGLIFPQPRPFSISSKNLRYQIRLVIQRYETAIIITKLLGDLAFAHGFVGDRMEFDPFTRIGAKVLIIPYRPRSERGILCERLKSADIILLRMEHLGESRASTTDDLVGVRVIFCGFEVS